MNALILVAHGSRRAESNASICTLAELLMPRLSAQYTWVVPAFLELEQPSIPSALQSLQSRGATRIDVMPYFLAPGRHVRFDIPEQIEAAQLPASIAVTLLPWLADDLSRMADFVAGNIAQQDSPIAASRALDAAFGLHSVRSERASPLH